MVVFTDIINLIQTELHMFDTNITNILSDFFDDTLYEQLDMIHDIYDKFSQLKINCP